MERLASLERVASLSSAERSYWSIQRCACSGTDNASGPNSSSGFSAWNCS